MRLLHFLPWYSPRTMGGTERFLLHLAKLQQARGDIVGIIAPNHVARSDHEIVDGIPVTYFPTTRDSGKAGFRSLVEEFSPDVMHLHGLDYVFREFVDFAAERGKPRLAMTLHLVNVICPDRRRKLPLGPVIDAFAASLHRVLGKRRSGYLFSRFFPYPTSFMSQALLLDFLRDSVTIDVLSPWYYEILLRMGFSPDRIRLRPNPMHVGGAFRSLPAVQVKGSIVKFLFVGRLSADKGVGTILQAISRLPDLSGQFEVIFIGREVDERILEQIGKLAGDGFKVLSAGEIPHTEVGRYVDEADYLLFASIKAEMAPLVIEEALARGRPVVASNHPSARASVTEGVNGRFFEPGSSTDLARIMRQIIESQSRLRFSFARITDQEEVLYNHYRDLYTTELQ